MIQVQFDDDSVLSTQRTKVWAKSEELPAAVASRLVSSYHTLITSARQIMSYPAFVYLLVC